MWPNTNIRTVFWNIPHLNGSDRKGVVSRSIDVTQNCILLLYVLLNKICYCITSDWNVMTSFICQINHVVDQFVLQMIFLRYIDSFSDKHFQVARHTIVVFNYSWILTNISNPSSDSIVVGPLNYKVVKDFRSSSSPTSCTEQHPIFIQKHTSINRVIVCLPRCATLACL